MTTPLPFTAGNTYAFVFGGNAQFYIANPGLYGGGDLLTYYHNPHLSDDLVFTVTEVATPATVPTMTEWAMILFGILLAGGAALMIQRRRLAV